MTNSGASRHNRPAKMNRPNLGRGGSNIKLFQPASKAEAVFTAWDGKLTCVRPFPAMDADSGELLPYTVDGDYTRWIEFHSAALKVGQSGSTWMLYDSDDLGYDRSSNPYRLVSDEVISAVKTSSLERYGWATLGGMTQEEWASRWVKTPKEIGLMQCAVYQVADDVFSPPKGSDPSGPLPVLIMTSTAIDSLFASLAEWRGDAVSLDHGAFLLFFQEGHDPRARKAGGSSFGAKPATGTARMATRSRRKFGQAYDCAVMDEFMGERPVLSEYAELVKGVVKPWGSVLEFPDNQKQVEYLCRALSPKLILDVLGTVYPDFIPDWVRAEAVKSVSIPAPAEIPVRDVVYDSTAGRDIPTVPFARHRTTDAAKTDPTVSDEDLPPPYDPSDEGFGGIAPPPPSRRNETFEDDDIPADGPLAAARAKSQERMRSGRYRAS